MTWLILTIAFLVWSVGYFLFKAGQSWFERPDYMWWAIGSFFTLYAVAALALSFLITPPGKGADVKLVISTLLGAAAQEEQF